MATIMLKFVLNGAPVELVAEEDATLLRVLRDQLHLMGTKEGCSEGECGACSLLVDGMLVNSCIYPAINAQGKRITTIEGVNEQGALNRIQQAFVDHGAIQCGYCTPGMVMAVTALLEENPHPQDAEIREAISGNICRCTGYQAIIDAVHELAQ